MSSLGYQSKSILSMELVESNKLYEFSAGKQYKFAKIIFQNTKRFLLNILFTALGKL